VHADDDASLAARVARQARVPHRRVVTREDSIADREARRRSGLTIRRPLLRDPQHAIGQLWIRMRRRRVRAAGQLGHPALQLLARDDALFHEQADVAIEPALVVARAEIVGRRHPLDGVAALVAGGAVLPGARAGAPRADSWRAGSG